MSKKKQQLIETAIRLLAQEGVSVATARIAKEAGVSNGTLFNHFETKQALFDEVYIHIKQQMADYVLNETNLAADTHDLLLSAWIVFAKWCNKYPSHRQTIELLYKSPVLSGSARESGKEFWRPILDRIPYGAKGGKFLGVCKDLVGLMAHSYLDALIVYAQEKNLNNMEIENLITQGFEMFWRGIQSKANPNISKTKGKPFVKADK